MTELVRSTDGRNGKRQRIKWQVSRSSDSQEGGERERSGKINLLLEFLLRHYFSSGWEDRKKVMMFACRNCHFHRLRPKR